MKNTYELTVTASCPADDSTDVYDVRITIYDVMLPVERILEAVRELTAHPVFQEDLTERLAAELDANVRSVGIHSGVRVVSRA